MMNRRSVLWALVGAGLSAQIAYADTYADQIVRQLTDQGFANIQVEVTLLGRVRIRGQGQQGLREIILNPNTGEILRDLWLDANGNPMLPRLVNSQNNGDNSGSNGNSGSGSDDNSGSGSDDGDDNSGSGPGDDRDDDKDDDKDDRDDDRDDRDDDNRGKDD